MGPRFGQIKTDALEMRLCESDLRHQISLRGADVRTVPILTPWKLLSDGDVGPRLTPDMARRNSRSLAGSA